MRTQKIISASLFVALSLGTASSASATSFSINLSDTYVTTSSPTDLTHPDFYIHSLTFTLPVGYTNASLNISTLRLDDRGVVELNGTIVTSSGITNGGGLSGQMIFTAGGPVQNYTFAHDFSDTVFAPITTGFIAGLNTIDIIVNDTSGGLNFRQGLLSGGYFWYVGRCFGSFPCDFTEVRDGITYFRGGPDPATRAELVATVTYDLADAPSATPLPAALPLFSSGLAGLGFVAYRRKRKQAA